MEVSMVTNHKKPILIIGIIAVITLTVLIPYLLFFYWMAPPWQELHRTETDFRRNKELIVIVRDYLITSNYDSITIHSVKEPETMFVMELGSVPISDSKVIDTVALLFNNGYQSITKKENAIVFLRWTGRDGGRGVVYSIDGQLPNESALPFLVRIEPLSIEGWYYYEEDFNEWKRRNRDS
jgi:hypothetical protein